MSDKQNNPSAFPRDNYHSGVAGMTLRDYFAGQALAGLMSQPTQGVPEDDARYCYRIADAMLATRAKTEASNV